MLRMKMGLLWVCLVFAGCEMPAATLPLPVLPDPSNIPPGTYTGTVQIAVTVTENGVPTNQTESADFTITINDDGFFLDTNGVPFMLNQVYQVDASPIIFTITVASISAPSNRIVIELDLVAVLNAGPLTGNLTGGQTDSLDYDPATNTIEFSRTQNYGGVLSDGTQLEFTSEAMGTLAP